MGREGIKVKAMVDPEEGQKSFDPRKFGQFVTSQGLLAVFVAGLPARRGLPAILLADLPAVFMADWQVLSAFLWRT